MMFALLVTCLVVLAKLCAAVQLPELYWNSSNSIFGPSQLGGLVMVAQILDRVNVYCPLVDTNDPSSSPEYLSMYMVSKEGFENCNLEETAEPILECRTPWKPTFITIVFRQYTPNPGALEFTPGRTYYFITTSDGSKKGIHENSGGFCKNKNMKMAVKIEENQLEEYPLTEGPAPTWRLPEMEPDISRSWSPKFGPKRRPVAMTTTPAPLLDTEVEDSLLKQLLYTLESADETEFGGNQAGHFISFEEPKTEQKWQAVNSEIRPLKEGRDYIIEYAAPGYAENWRDYYHVLSSARSSSQSTWFSLMRTFAVLILAFTLRQCLCR